MARTKAPLDGVALVGKHWRYDGPHNEDTVLEAARAVAHLVRYLNNATGPGNGERTLPYGAVVRRVLSSVTASLGSLDQLLDQLATAAARVGADPLSYDERRDRPASQTTDQLRQEIAKARDLLFHDWTTGEPESANVHMYLQSASNYASRIGYDG